MAYNPPTILMADDDFEDLELIEDAITKLEPDADLYKVMNGQAVIDFLANQSDTKLPCLIILDYNMPELNGSEVLAAIRKEKRYELIPKVILSTSNTPAYIHECLKNGAAEYFVKPDNVRDLANVAKKMLTYCKTD